MDSSFLIGGTFQVSCFDSYGVLKWKTTAKNAVTNQGLNSILDTMFHGATQTTTWYIGLIDNAGFSELAAADTLGTHAGWTENTDYADNRKEWAEGAASSQSMTNATTADFVINADSKTIYGAFLCSVATGASGTLFCTAAFTGGTQAVNTGDTLKVTYTLSAAAG